MVAFAPVLMLAHSEQQLPTGDRWLYEPKLDGFRGLLWRRGDSDATLLSRNLKELTPWFPELAQAGRALPPNTILDGEIVVADDHGTSDFDALQRRMGLGRRDAQMAANRRPVV